MATNENLQQINTFTGGMNSDTSDALLKNDQYRLAKNLSLSLNEEENEGELHVMHGLGRICSFDKAVSKILATTVCRDYGVVIYQSDTSWYIGVFKNNDNKVKNIFGPCNTQIGNKVSVVSRYESDKNAKIYIADGIHNLMAINIPDELDKQNIETDIQYLIAYANTTLTPPTIKFELNSAGHLMSGRVQYSYTLYNEGMGETSMSPLSNVCSIYRDSESGYAPGDISSKSIDVEIDVPKDTPILKIRVYRISYVYGGQEPEIHIVADTELSKYQIVGNNIHFTMTDTGDNLEQISLSDFLSLLQNDVIPKIIESKNDYLFAANIKYTQDEFDKKITPFIDTIRDSVQTKMVKSEQYTENSFGKIIRGRENYKPSLMPNEIYRYGIIFYDKNGKKSSVYKLFDYTAPDEGYFENYECLNNSSDYNIDAEFKLRSFGVNIKFNIPQQIKNVCSGLEIVRCENTPETQRVLSYGIVGRTYNEGNFYWPAHYLSMDQVSVPDPNKRVRTKRELQIFGCPEYCYDKENFQQKLKYFKQNVQLEYQKYTFLPSGITMHGDEYPSPSGNEFVACMFNGSPHSTTIKRLGVGKYIGAALFEGTDTLPPPIGTYFIGPPTVFTYYTAPDDFSFLAWGRLQDLIGDKDVATSQGVFPTDAYSYEATRASAQRVYAAYVIPESIKWKQTKESANIQDLDFVSASNPLGFANTTKNVTVMGDEYNFVSGKRYVNWSSTLLFDKNGLRKDVDDWKTDGSGRWWFDGVWEREMRDPDVSAGGSCIILDMGNIDEDLTQVHSGAENNLKIYIGAIVKKEGSYGYSKTEASSYTDIYRSHGNYFKIGESLQFDQDIFDGDSWLNMFNFQYLHAQEDPFFHLSTTPVIYSVPLFSRVDLAGKQGAYKAIVKSKEGVYFQEDPVVTKFYTQSQSAYLYNLAYSQEQNVIALYESLYTKVSSGDYDYRVLVSNQKTNNEVIDNWLKFKSANFIDVDTAFGKITELRLFKNELLYWQEDAFGKLSVNERQLLQTTDNSQLVLGTGGILDRYDYITTSLGMTEDQYVDKQSRSALYWWDYNRKKIAKYSNDGVQILQDVTSMKNYINTHTPSHSPSIAYDQKDNNVLFNIFNTNPIVYNENINRFISEWEQKFDASEIIDGLTVYMKGGSNEGVYKCNSKNILKPYLKYIVNKLPVYNKVFDNVVLSGRLYGGDDLSNIKFTFATPLKQNSEITLSQQKLTNREYDFRFAVPRNNGSLYGDRMRGKTMQCELISDNTSSDFSLQFITTKYRISWT